MNFETGINGVYNLFDRDGFHYCVYGGTKVLKTTDDNVVRGPVRVVKSVDVAAAMPPEAAKAVTRIIGLNMTYDGHIAAAAPARVVVLDRDLNVKSYVTFSGEAVDNSIAIDEKNGIYVVTSRRMLKLVVERTEALDRGEGRRLGVRLRMDPGREGAGCGLDLARLGHDADVDGLRQRPGQAGCDRGCGRNRDEPRGVLARRDTCRFPAEAGHQVAPYR